MNPDNTYEIIECPVEWPFGHGLSYTTFSYSTPTLSSSTITEDDLLEVSFRVTNMGPKAGKDSILLFITDYARRVTPEKKLLKRFAKTPLLQPGESYQFTTTISAREDLSYYGIADGANSRKMMESGLFYIGIGPKADCRAHPEACMNFTLSLTDKYNPVCEAACRMWGKARTSCPNEDIAGLSGPARAFMGEGPTSPGAATCHSRCLKDQDWDWNYVSCLERQVWSGKCKMGHQCRSWPVEEDEKVVHGDTRESLPPSPQERVDHGRGKDDEDDHGGRRSRGAMLAAMPGPSPSTTSTPLRSPWVPFLGGTVCGALGVLGFLIFTGRASPRLTSRRGRSTTPLAMYREGQ